MTHHALFSDFLAWLVQTGNHDAWFQILKVQSTALFGAKYGYGSALGVGGGSVTQNNSKTQSVTLNALVGQVTMNAASLAAGATATFTLSNIYIGADDEVTCWKKGGGLTAAYDAKVESVSAGACSISVTNKTAGALAEPLVLGFAVRSGAVGPVTGDGGAIPLVNAMLLGLNRGLFTTYSGSLLFANVTKQMSGWRQVAGSGTFTDDQGVLTATVSTDHFSAYIEDFGGCIPVGTYSVKVPAGGKIGISTNPGNDAAPEKSGGGYQASNFQFTIDGTEGGLHVFSEGSCPAGFKIIAPGQADDPTNPWHSDFLAFVHASGEKMFRSMDWTLGARNKDKEWADRVRPDRTNLIPKSLGQNGFGPCMPWEYIIDLANRCSIDPYVTIPFGVSDAYVAAFGDLANNGTGALGTAGTTGLAAGRTLMLEYTNECWNDAADYYASTTWNRYAHVASMDVTMTPATNATRFIFTTPHGCSLNDEVRFWAKPSSYNNYVQDAGTDQFNVVAWGFPVYVKTIIDANTIEISTSLGGAVYTPPNKGPYAFFCKRTQGAADQLNDNYAQRAKSIWSTVKTKMGSSRVYTVLGAWAGRATDIATPRLASTGVAAVTQGLAIAPYFAGEQLMMCLDITGATTVRPSLWALRNGAARFAAFAAGTAAPTENAIANGTGASGTTTGIASYNKAIGRPTVADGSITGLTSGVSYDVYGQYNNTQDTDGRTRYKHRIKGTVTPGAAFAATSVTSMPITTGVVNMTVQTGKTFPVGQLVTIERSTDPTYFMVGSVTSYNSGTGALVVQVNQFRTNNPDAPLTPSYASWNVFTRLNVFPTIAEEALRNKLDVTYSILGQMVVPHLAAIAASSNPAIELITYEGGNSMNQDGHPDELTTWTNGTFLPTTQHAGAMGLYLQAVADENVKKFEWFSDFQVKQSPWTCFQLTPSYTNLTDPRFVKFASYGGVVAKGTRLAISNRTANGPTSAPTYPVVVDTMPDATLTYAVLGGDPDGNFDFSGANLRLVNGTGINYSVTNDKTLYVRAESADGSRDCIFTVDVNVGLASPFEPDALAAFNSVADTDPAVMNMVKGADLALTSGFGATITGGMWDTSAGSPMTRYSNSAAMTAPIDFSKGVLAVVVVDRNGATATDDPIHRFGIYPKVLTTQNFLGTQFVWAFAYGTNSVNYTSSFAASGTKQAFWWWFDVDNNKVYHGTNQTDESGGGVAPPGDYTTPTGTIGNVDVGQSVTKYGSFELVNRPGMTLAQVKAIVQKIQNLHGI